MTMCPWYLLLVLFLSLGTCSARFRSLRVNHGLLKLSTEPKLLPPDATEVDTSFGTSLLTANASPSTKTVLESPDEVNPASDVASAAPDATAAPGADVADVADVADAANAADGAFATATDVAAAATANDGTSSSATGAPTATPIKEGQTSCVSISIQSDDAAISKGAIVLELDGAAAPTTVANFLKYVDSKYYEGTIFHRVIPGFMIQTGGFTNKFYSGTTEEKQGQQPSIRNEASSERKNSKYTVAMARTSDPDSATSQFYINVADNDSLDGDHDSGYNVFGKVVKGQEHVDEIAATKTSTIGSFDDVPLKKTEIIAVEHVSC